MNEEYITKNLNEAAFLSLEHEIKDYRRDTKDIKIVWFVFDISAQKDADKYFDGETSVDAKRFAEQVQRIKDKIFLVPKPTSESESEHNFNK